MSPLEPAAALDLLRHGELEIEGRLAEASNTTLRAVITHDGVEARCVYKPLRGERPLWDFPDGTLAGREVATYELSAATGWAVVPPTVLREHGPLGPGACQLWIDVPERADPVVDFVPADGVPAGWLPIAEARDELGAPFLLAHADDDRLRRLAAFDAVVNNADRKGAHLLTGPDGHLYGVDHGVCLHRDDKLRTVLWGFAGRKLSSDIRAVLKELRRGIDGGPLADTIEEHVTGAEIRAVRRRIDRLLSTGVHPAPRDGWPALPWPPL